jgi:hypothetical protein
MFADDTKIFNTIKSTDDITLIQEDINNLLKWSHTWQLPFNVNKCKVLHFGKNNPQHTYTMGDQELTNDTSEKDVGVTFDTNFNFKTHINQMIAKANSRVGMVKRSFSKLNITSFKIIYKSLIRPILEYCSSIWFPLYKYESAEIEKVQKRATKLVPELKDLSYPSRLRKLNITTLLYRRERTDMIQVFKILNNFDNIDPNQFFEFNTGNNRGHCAKLLKPRAQTKIRANVFSNRIINLWNALPEEAVQSKTINSFKNSLERAWLHRESKFGSDAE